VTLTLKRQQQQALIFVRDNGIGMAREQQSKVFDRFYRVDEARIGQSGNSGLGLGSPKPSLKPIMAVFQSLVGPIRAACSLSHYRCQQINNGSTWLSFTPFHPHFIFGFYNFYSQYLTKGFDFVCA
jgi:hypothetical protein